MKDVTSFVVAAAGTTGNNTHTIPALTEVPAAGLLALQINVSAVGGTPTATFTVQGTVDGVVFFALPYKTFLSDVEATAAIVITTVSAIYPVVDLAKRPLKSVQVAVTANTNVTYGITAVARRDG